MRCWLSEKQITAFTYIIIRSFKIILAGTKYEE